MLNTKKKSMVALMTAMIAILVMSIMICAFTIPTVSAEEARSSKDFIEQTSLTADMYADKHDSADARISTYLHLKPSGDGLFMIEGEIQPRMNDGSHDYKVRWFTLDLNITDDNKSMTDITSKDNSTEKIVTTGSGAGLTISNDGISFNIGSSSEMTTNTSSVHANYSHYESIKGQKEINKSIRVEPIKSITDTTYAFSVAFFFKFDGVSTNNLNYSLVMKEMRLDGIVFAPDYGTNSSECLKTTGKANLNGVRSSAGDIVDIGDDGSPNDWLDHKNFAHFPDFK